jgi:quinol monooxygenase YgiN
VCIDEASAQSTPLYINAVDIDVVPGQIANYLAALKGECRRLGTCAWPPRVQHRGGAKRQEHVFIFEVYDNAAALDAHRQTDHFKKYATTTKDMVAKRDPHQLSLVATYARGM